ncbi:subtilase family protein [Prauserella shujinwangii]|uniref:Subtilase family protein n=1 Tax=Prauserella shujinwangii TaxID=1453103 RepID=A0A2T0LY82_9PSEU|nr:S8 family serine peptidase [Prauserella shujinwangii]PRX49083.1 subtilase family protein [Prauserella shujinwangii]
MPERITLITGDHVIATTTGRPPRVRPGPGRDEIVFSLFAEGDRFFVVPSDASQRLAAGTLDRRLFDITTLLEFEYDDAHRDTIPIIVEYAGGADAATTVQRVSGARVEQRLASIDGAAARVDKGSATGLWNALTAEAGVSALAGAVTRIWLDGIRWAVLDESVPQVGAPAAWDAGYTGSGVTVAVLDSGVDHDHPDLAGRQRAQRNFAGTPTDDDRLGHGTHVASIAVGTGAASDGTYRGVAYEAEYLDGKVLDDFGRGQESWIIAGMEWAAAEQGADIVNMSLGGPNLPTIDPVEEALNTLSAEHGTLFVVAAGNDGPLPGTINSPGSARAAFTVGSVNERDQLAERSSRGPLPGGRALKPDVTAPGVRIVAARSSEGMIGEPVGEHYVELSGTSMATPHVAGATALLRQQHPELTGEQLRSLLVGSARPTEGLTIFEQGTGRIDSAAALAQRMLAEPSEVNFGIRRWPHVDAEPVAIELTYTNLGDAELTVELDLDVSGPAGDPAPPGVITLARSRLTVPAGGSASVVVTGDISTVTEPGSYSGTLVARDGDTEVRTPVGIGREPESYDLTLRHVAPDGTPADTYFTQLWDVDSGETWSPYEPDGTVTLRLRAGTYLLQTLIPAEADDGTVHRHLLAYPQLTLDRDITVDLDARAAEPVRVTPPEPDATARLGEVSYTRPIAGRDATFHLVVFSGPVERIRMAHLGPDLPHEKLRALVSTQWTAAGNTALYGLAWYEYGRVPTGFVRLVRPEDLATVRVDYGTPRPRTTGEAGPAPVPHLGWDTGVANFTDIGIPAVRTEYYNTGDGTVDWKRWLYTSDAETGRLITTLESPQEQYEPGREYEESMNYAVFGPVLPLTCNPQQWVVRNGDTIDVNTPLFGDRGGNWGRSSDEGTYTRLSREGELIGENSVAGSGVFTVPAEEAEYRLAAGGGRGPLFDVGARVAASWTFRSGHTEEPTRLPVWTIRYFPELDDDNSAPSGRPFTVPVAVQEQASARTETPARLDAEVSYDNGHTWTAAEVDGNARLLLHHPVGASTVSLRATAVNRDGSTVEQTLIDAYQLR